MGQWWRECSIMESQGRAWWTPFESFCVWRWKGGRVVSGKNRSVTDMERNMSSAGDEWEQTKAIHDSGCRFVYMYDNVTLTDESLCWLEFAFRVPVRSRLSGPAHNEVLSYLWLYWYEIKKGSTLCVCVCVCAVSYTHLTLPTRRTV